MATDLVREAVPQAPAAEMPWPLARCHVRQRIWFGKGFPLYREPRVRADSTLPKTSHHGDGERFGRVAVAVTVTVAAANVNAVAVTVAAPNAVANAL